MVRGVLIALVVLAVWPVSAGAVDFDVRFPNGTVAQPYRSWAHNAFVPPPTGVILLSTDTTICKARPACALPDPPTIYLKTNRSRRDVKQDFEHELGHVFDYTVMTDDARNSFEQIIGDYRPWRSRSNSPHEKFAEGYRLCALYERLTPGERNTAGYDYDPDQRQHRRVCALIRRQAARRDAAAPRLSRSRRSLRPS